VSIPLRTARTKYIRVSDSLSTDEETALARKTIFVSDLTGEEIDEKNAAAVTISTRTRDARRWCST
jgi:hypothetical protein